MYHEATACHVTGDLTEVLMILHNLLVCCRPHSNRPGTIAKKCMVYFTVYMPCVSSCKCVFVCLFVVVVVIFFKQGKFLNYVPLPSQRSWWDCYATRENLEFSFTCSQTSCGGMCAQAINTSNSGSGGPGFKPRPSRCFPRQGTLLYFVSLRPGV